MDCWYPLLTRRISDKDVNPFDVDWEIEENEDDGYDDVFGTCPDCGCGISLRNDGGNGFCNSGAVLFFLELHSEVKIKERMSCEEIYLAMVRGNIIGTGSIRKNEICRLFILPEYQGKGYGSRLMDLLEARIFENYPKVHVDASFPAESMYLKRGYQIVSYEIIETENGDFLCYHTMEKEKCRNLSV